MALNPKAQGRRLRADSTAATTPASAGLATMVQVDAFGGVVLPSTWPEPGWMQTSTPLLYMAHPTGEPAGRIGCCAETAAFSEPVVSALVRPNVRAKRATTAGRQARATENVHRTCGPGLVACRWRSA